MLIVKIVVLLVLPLPFTESKEPDLPLVHQILKETINTSVGLRGGLRLELLSHLAFLQGVANDRVAARATVVQAKTIIRDAQGWIHDDNDMLRVVPYLLELAVTEGKLGEATEQALTIKQATALVSAASDVEKKLVAIGDVAAAYIKAGAIPRALQTLAWANQVVENDVQESRKDVIVKIKLWRIAEPLVEYGYPNQAVQMMWDMVESINTNLKRKNWSGASFSYYKPIGKVLAKTKDVEALKTFVEVWKEQKASFPPSKFLDADIMDLLWLSELFREVGEQQTALDYLEQARILAHDRVFALPLIEDPSRFILDHRYHAAARSWSGIAIQAARLGKLERAREAETHIPLSWQKGHSVFFIAEAQLRNGDRAGARETAQLTVRTKDTYTLGRIVVAQAQDGDVEGAVGSFERLEYLLDSDAKLQEYLARLESTEYPPCFLEAIRAVAKARILAGDVAETVTWANRQPTPYKKTYALLGIAEGLLEEKQGPLGANLSVQGCPANPSPGRYF